MLVRTPTHCLYLFVCLSLLSPLKTHTIGYDSYRNASENILFAALSLSAMAGIYLIGYKLGCWGYESHEQLIERTHKHLNELSSYLPMTGLINAAGPYFEPHVTLNEDLLYHLAFIKRGDVAIDNFIRSLRRTTKDTHILYQTVQKRSTYLKNESNWSENRVKCYQLDELNARLYKAGQELEKLLIILEKHAGYFKLFEHEDYARNNYADELQLLEKFTHIQTFREALRASILGKSNKQFALVEFMHRLQRDCKTMDELIGRSAYNYTVRMGYAHDLVNRLHHIEQAIYNDPEYQYILLEYQKYQYERERKLLERKDRGYTKSDIAKSEDKGISQEYAMEQSKHRAKAVVFSDGE